jgi:malate/lactate dehydrogenase
VSRVHPSVFGRSGLALSLPAIVGQSGAGPVVTPELDEDERERLEHSADVLRQSIRTLDAQADRL